MIVIPCYHDPLHNHVQTCVRSVRRFMSGERILVVDSGSPSKAYFDEVEILGATVADVGNKHYETGAWWYAYEHYPDEATYYCIHDSTWLQADLRRCRQPGPLTVPGYMRTWEGCDTLMIEATERLLASVGLKAPSAFWACAGSMFFVDRSVLALVAQTPYAALRPTNKTEAMAMERIWGIAFGSLGFTPERVAWGPDEYLYERPDSPLHKVLGNRP